MVQSMKLSFSTPLKKIILVPCL